MSTRTHILIGNGPSAITRDLGAVIDAHDCVIRCNRYVTAGLERHVGRRCTHWATHGATWQDVRSGRRTPMAPAEGSARPEAVILTHAHIPSPLPPEVPAEHVRADIAAELVARLGLTGPQIPTTGLTVLYWLLRDRGVRRVHLVGFDGFSKAKSKAHHYWEKKSYKRPTEHDGDAELRLIRHWAAVGRVSLLT